MKEIQGSITSKLHGQSWLYFLLSYYNAVGETHPMQIKNEHLSKTTEGHQDVGKCIAQISNPYWTCFHLQWIDDKLSMTLAINQYIALTSKHSTGSNLMTETAYADKVLPCNPWKRLQLMYNKRSIYFPLRCLILILFLNNFFPKRNAQHQLL